jgi:hypothetical protein
VLSSAILDSYIAECSLFSNEICVTIADIIDEIALLASLLGIKSLLYALSLK